MVANNVNTCSSDVLIIELFSSHVHDVFLIIINFREVQSGSRILCMCGHQLEDGGATLVNGNEILP